MLLMKLVDLVKVYLAGKAIETRALNGVTLEIQEGDFMVISGPSGSGKTTLLNLMGGLDSPTKGTVYLKDIPISSMNEKQLAKVRRENFGFIFQAYNLIPVLTAEENIEYVMMLQGVIVQERKERIHRITRRLGIHELLNKRPNEMSGGQQQRVAVARAVVSRPKVIFADEPTANLDSGNSSTLLELMKQLNEEENMTFVFSTHDPVLRQKAKRQIVLKDGKIV
ncbi:MAG: ABC transporter ATP-binding protein [Candidatus Omnitrophota bacterium]